QQIDGGALQDGLHLLAVAGDGNMQAMPLEELAQEVARAAVVVDDEDMGVGLHGTAPVGSRASRDRQRFPHCGKIEDAEGSALRNPPSATGATSPLQNSANGKNAGKERSIERMRCR